MIPYSRQDISQADIDAVMDVLRSDFLTQGSMVPRFEDAVTQYCGAQHAVAVNSATSALHIACLALELGPGDWLWTSPNTFVASANAALYCGAKVDFVDIDPSTYNMSAELLEEKLEYAEKIGRLPKIVMPVHFAGQPCDMLKIHLLSQQYGFKIIEDYGNNGFYCFDDLGVETTGRHFGKDCYVMGEILLSRYDLFLKRKIRTHTTTNLNAQELESRYGIRVRSRMRELFNLIAFDKESLDKRV